MRVDSSKALRWILFAFALIALFLLLAEHHAHGLGLLVMLLIPLCLLLLYLSGSQAERGARDSGRIHHPKSSDHEGKQP